MQRRLIVFVGCASALYLFSLLLQRHSGSLHAGSLTSDSKEYHRLKKRQDDSWTESSTDSTSTSDAPVLLQAAVDDTLPGSCNYITLSQEQPDDGLGSLMFQYASLYGIASWNKKLPFLDSSFPLYDKFDLSVPQEDGYSIEGFKTLAETEGCCSYQNPEIQCDANVTLSGYRRSWRYFHRQRAQLQREFQLSPDLHKMCLRNYSRLLSDFQIDRSKCLLIGVHARTGPLQPTPTGNITNHAIDSADYLRRAMAHFKTEYREDYACIAYVILGNNYEWIYKLIVEDRESLDFKDASTQFAFYSTGDPIMDFCILTHTNHTIFTYGALGWWIAYLTGGLVTYQKEYADVLAGIKEYKISDYYLPEWNAL